MRRAIPFVLALGFVSFPAAAEPPLAAPPPPPAPAAMAARASEIELTHIGIAAVAVGVFSGTIAASCGEAYGGSGLVKCRWAAGSVAVGIAAASVPFFILGARQARIGWISDRVTVVAGPRGVTLGLAATF